MAVPRDDRKFEMLSSPSGVVTSDIASTPGPLRRACGRLLIVVAPVPSVAPLVALFQSWDRLGEASTPHWVLPLVMLCYVAFSVAVLVRGERLGERSCRACEDRMLAFSRHVVAVLDVVQYFRLRVKGGLYTSCRQYQHLIPLPVYFSADWCDIDTNGLGGASCPH